MPKNTLSNIPTGMEGALSREEHKNEDWERLAAQDREVLPYQNIVVAANYFRPQNKLGVGDFVSVYKGMLEDGREIAVKKLAKKSEKGMKEFVRDVRLLSRLKHPNVVRLVGYAVARDCEPLLVYKYVPSAIDLGKQFRSIRREQINWTHRFEIIKGIAKGLNYLHGGSGNRIIIHRNIIPSNILLDDNWRPMIGGFSRAYILDEHQTHVNTHVDGTQYSHYIPPEYWKHGYLSKKTDIYSFGVLVLKLISGTIYRQYQKIGNTTDLLNWAHRYYLEKRSLEIMDYSLQDSAVTEQVTNCIIIGLLCVQGNPKSRPGMDHVVSMLTENQDMIGMQIGKPGLLGFDKSDLIDSHVSSQQTQRFRDAYQASGDEIQNQGEFEVVDKYQVQESPSNSNQVKKEASGDEIQNQGEFEVVDEHQVQESPSNSNKVKKEDEDSDKGHKAKNLKKKIAAQNCQKFSHETLSNATNKFASQNVLGEGGFGVVYKGTLVDGREIAVKKSSKITEEKRNTLIQEIELLSTVKHPNVVKLFGYCADDNECLLVYEYVPNQSLDKHLFGPSGRKQELDWTRTYNIIIGVAKGLNYLHADPQNCIVHRDIKANNILVDHKWVPKIGDFGISRLFDVDRTHASTDPLGTWGYVAPEHLELRHMSKMTDVYSFGVLVLELVSGKRYNFVPPPPQNNIIGLLDWTYKHFKMGKILKIMDPALAISAVTVQVETCIKVGLLCVQGDPKLRFDMEWVLSTLTLNQLPKEISIGKPGFLGFRDRSISSSDPDDDQEEFVDFSDNLVEEEKENCCTIIL